MEDQVAYYSSDEDVAWGPRPLREIEREFNSKTCHRRQTVAHFPDCRKSDTEMQLNSSLSTNNDYLSVNNTVESKYVSTMPIRYNNENNVNSCSSPTNSSNSISNRGSPTEKFSCTSEKINGADFPDFRKGDTPQNSSSSTNNEYLTANETVESKSVSIQTNEHDTKNNVNSSLSPTNSPINFICSGFSSYKFSVTPEKMKNDSTKTSDQFKFFNEDEVMSISSDDNGYDEDRDRFNIKTEQLSENSDGFSMEKSNSSHRASTPEDVDEIISLSSSADEDFENGHSKEDQASCYRNEEDLEVNDISKDYHYEAYELPHVSTEYLDVPQILITQATPSKKTTNTSEMSSTSIYTTPNAASKNLEDIVSNSSSVEEIDIHGETPAGLISRYSSNISEAFSINLTNSGCSNAGSGEDSEYDLLNGTFDDMADLLNESNHNSEPESNILRDASIRMNRSESSRNYFEEERSRIPKPIFQSSSCDNISKHSSQEEDFKVPQNPLRNPKKSPFVDRKLTPMRKTSPNVFKDIVSPVRMYIKNSAQPVLKRNCKQRMVRGNILGAISENSALAPRKHKNLLDSLPELIYKPSRQVLEKFYSQIILPGNIKKLVKERIVFKHEVRERVNLDESELSTGEKLNKGDLSYIVNDVKNMSLHTAKHGFNM